jgi:D-alanyl-lipoteichoic acid acyltransferase DltB (MBOAT superfamily)
MTLSRWLRDYLYIPLGGNRVSYVRTYVNLFLTMVIGGLWHGANWTFVIWGAIHGGGLAIERLVKERWTERGPLGVPVVVVKVLQWAVTFVVVCLAWVFFRATSAANAFEVIGQLFTGEMLPGAKSLVTPMVVGVVVLSVASQFVPPEIPAKVTVAFARTPPILQVIVAAAGLALINVLGPEGVAPFIYFPF